MPRLLIQGLPVMHHPCSCNKSVLLLLAWHSPQTLPSAQNPGYPLPKRNHMLPGPSPSESSLTTLVQLGP